MRLGGRSLLPFSVLFKKGPHCENTGPGARPAAARGGPGSLTFRELNPRPDRIISPGLAEGRGVYQASTSRRTKTANAVASAARAQAARTPAPKPTVRPGI